MSSDNLTEPLRELLEATGPVEGGTMNVRAKFVVQSITRYAGATGQTVELWPVAADGVPENERYHRATPSGLLRITVDNPHVLEAFRARMGRAVYLDFSEAD